METTIIKTEYSSVMNPQQVCRLCLSQELLEEIFAHKDLNQLIAGYLSIVVSENDSLSQCICFLCRSRLQDFRDFQLSCLEVQEVLQNESTPFVKEEPLEETEEAGQSSDPDGELVIDEGSQPTTTVAEENLQPPVLEAAEPVPKPTFRIVHKRVKYDHEKKQPCSICGHKVHDTRMEGHQNRHKGLKPYVCIYGCENVSFHCRIAQLSHVRNKHSTQRYACNMCDNFFESNKKLYDHKRITHTSRTKLCAICGKAFLTPSALKEHMNFHNPNRERKYACPICNFAFHKNWRMKLHMKTHEKESTSGRKKSPSKQKIAEKNDTFTTDENRSASIEIGNVKIEQDAEVAESYSWVECGEEPVKSECNIQPTELDSHQLDGLKSESEQPQSSNLSKKRSPDPFVNCFTCGKQIRQSAMEGHQNKHMDYRPYRCERGCDELTFHCQASRDRHYRSVHSTPKKCDICHKQYPSEASLANHKKYMHVEKRFSCNFCDKTFPTSSHAKQHMKKCHSG